MEHKELEGTGSSLVIAMSCPSWSIEDGQDQGNSAGPRELIPKSLCILLIKHR